MIGSSANGSDSRLQFCWILIILAWVVWCFMWEWHEVSSCDCIKPVIPKHSKNQNTVKRFFFLFFPLWFLSLWLTFFSVVIYMLSKYFHYFLHLICAGVWEKKREVEVLMVIKLVLIYVNIRIIQGKLFWVGLFVNICMISI